MPWIFLNCLTVISQRFFLVSKLGFDDSRIKI